MLLVLTHLFRKRGKEVSLNDAVGFLSFQCRYGAPTDVRKLLAIALKNEMITRDSDKIIAQFLYDKQSLSLNQSAVLQNKVVFRDETVPMY